MIERFERLIDLITFCFECWTTYRSPSSCILSPPLLHISFTIDFKQHSTRKKTKQQQKKKKKGARNKYWRSTHLSSDTILSYEMKDLILSFCTCADTTEDLDTWHIKHKPNDCIDLAAFGDFGTFFIRAGSAVWHSSTIFEHGTQPGHVSISIHSSPDSFSGAFNSIISALLEQRLKEDGGGDPSLVTLNIRLMRRHFCREKTTHALRHTAWWNAVVLVLTHL